ncbi:MAG: metallophosphoesterase [Myxococcota bacterium]
MPSVPSLSLAARAALAVVLVAFVGCRALPDAPASAAPPESVRRDAPLTAAPKERVRLVLIGDTGMPGPAMEAVHRAVVAEAKDYVIVLGDLVYPEAPLCRDGTMSADVRALLDQRIGTALRGLGAPVLLVLGNHDVAHARRDPDREACILAYAAAEPELLMPSRAYTLDLGVAILALLDSNDLDDEQAVMARAAFADHKGWKLMAAHHVLRCYHDKSSEDSVRPWLAQHRLKPDAWLNGHAHLLQFGVYEGIPALTSGATAAARDRPACPPSCGEGQLFGGSMPGYAVVELTDKQMDVTFKDTDGNELFAWKRTR